MNYEFLNRAPNGDYRYKVSLHVFRDDLNSIVGFADEIKLGIYLNNDAQDLYDVVNIRRVTTFEVPAPGSIDCDDVRKKVRIFFGLFEGVITLKPNVTGYHLSYVQCCRNVQDNLTDDGGNPDQGQTYYAFIPSTSYENSSPSFYGVPSPYMCSLDTTSFLFDAVDKDGDSLSYNFMRPHAGGTPLANTPDPERNLTLKRLIYKSGFSAAAPFGSGGYFQVDENTGRTLLSAPSPGRYVIGVEVTEFRNGVELSTIRMDLQIDVLACQENNVPEITSSDGKEFIIEEGEELCFDVTGFDVDSNNMTVEGRSVLLGDGDTVGIAQATFTDVQGAVEVTSEFCWIPDCDDARRDPYNVFFTVTDDGCPPKFNHLDVQIKVIPFEGAETLTGPTTVCRYNMYDYTIEGGGASSNFEWYVTEGVISGDPTDSTVSIDWEGSGTGIVRAREVSKNGCLGEWIEIQVTINESPDLPIILGEDTVCINELTHTYSVADPDNNSFDWEVDNATFTIQNTNEIIINSYNIPDFEIRVVETNSTGCPSDTATLEVYVSVPSPEILGPENVCPNAQEVMYEVDTPVLGSVYTWTVNGGIQVSGSSSPSIRVDWGNEGLGEVRVFETNKFGCVSIQDIHRVDKTYDLGFVSLIGNTSVCEFDQGELYSALETEGSVYRWTVSGGVQTAGDSSSTILVDWGETGMGMVSVFQRAFDNVNGRECLGTQVDLPVTIHPLPTADEIIGSMKLCQFDDSTEYTISGFPNSTFEWRINGSTIGIIGQGTNTIKVTWNTPGAFSLSVFEVSEFDCQGELIDTLVTVNPKPTTSNIYGERIICPENIASLTYSVVGFSNSTFNWEVSDGVIVAGQGSTQITVDWNTQSTASNVSVVEISEFGCFGDTIRLDIEFDNLEIDLRNVTVGTPDNRIEINWELETPAITDIFQIQRRPSNSGQEFSNVSSVDGSAFTYTDVGINTDVNSFDYVVTSTNRCGTVIESEIHTSILLTGVQDEKLNTILDFTDYLGWVNGVSNYDLFARGNDATFNPLRFGSTPGSPILIDFDPQSYKRCYRIFAEEDEGDFTTSWSNEVCFFFSPVVIVPNAFTPNGDGLNDGFGVRGIAVKEFIIQIYNRWGERIYESTDIEEKWFPTYRDRDVQMGTYMYLITFTDSQDKMYKKSGTINLIR